MKVGDEVITLITCGFRAEHLKGETAKIHQVVDEDEYQLIFPDGITWFVNRLFIEPKDSKPVVFNITYL